MAYDFRYKNPKMAGAIVEEKVSCGKTNCRCGGTKRLHGPYCYLYWRDRLNGGVLRKRYVRRQEVEALRKDMEALKTKDKWDKGIIETLTSENLQLIRDVYAQYVTKNNNE